MSVEVVNMKINVGTIKAKCKINLDNLPWNKNPKPNLNLVIQAAINTLY